MNAFLRSCAWSLFLAIPGLAVADDAPCAPCARAATPPPVYQRVATPVACVEKNEQPSWIFRPGTYTHDPVTGVRVAQYMRTPRVEPLDDERNVTSRYRRSRTNLPGADGSIDTYYEVQAWGNGRGGIDAEWERFHDAWKESYLQGGYYNQSPVYGPGPWTHNPGVYGPGYGHPGYGYGYPGYDGYGTPGHGSHPGGP